MVKLTESLVLARSRASDLESVRKLNCWGNDLTDVTILRKMPNVTIVSLSVNKIRTLEDFSFCKSLEELYIRKNQIDDLHDVCYLKSLPKLRNLWLADNPCASADNYRSTVLKTLPNLHKLDNVTVSEEEINEAIEKGDTLDLAESEDDRVGEERQLDLADGADGKTAEAADGSGASACGAGGDSTPRAEAGSCAAAQNEEKSPVQMSWEETNKIRLQLGLKPLSVEKAVPQKPRWPVSNAKARNANVLQATLCLIKELDAESLEVIADAVRNRLELL